MPWWLIALVFAVVGFTVRPHELKGKRDHSGTPTDVAKPVPQDDVGAWRHEFNAWQTQLNAVAGRIGVVNAGLYVVAATAVVAYVALRDHGGMLSDTFVAPLLVALIGALALRVHSKDAVNPALELSRSRQRFKASEERRLEVVVGIMERSVDAQERVLRWKEWGEVAAAVLFAIVMILVGILAPTSESDQNQPTAGVVQPLTKWVI